MRMDYLAARDSLEQAEGMAWQSRDWDTLSRLYMPLQEVHRQMRQRCAEGIVCLDLIAKSPSDALDPNAILKQFPHGQLLVAGWNSIGPALTVRRLARERHLYVETFLASVHSESSLSRTIAVHPLDGSSGFTLHESEVPGGASKASADTYALVMGWWERLHRSFLNQADQASDPLQRIQAYRRTIEVDYACELAHQKLSALAHELSRTAGRQ